MDKIHVLSLFLAAALARNAKIGQVPDEQRLYRDLMDGYEASIRPVLNSSQRVTVQFDLALKQIVGLEERENVLTTQVIITQSWPDEHLSWEPEKYNGIRSLRVPATYVWLPDTFIFNNADDGATGFMSSVYVLLNANGTVLWPVPVKLRSSCKVDIAYFPFDDQTCLLRFGSWIYSGEWLDFESSLERIDLSNYIDNSEWRLRSLEFEKNFASNSSSQQQHPGLLYTLHIRRRALYYIFNIIVPCIMLSILTLLTFWLPATSGEKISLGLSVFLAFSMFMLLIAEEVPATSESVPLIGIYLTTVMTMTSTSVIMAVMIINLYNRGHKARGAPAWLKVVTLNWLSRVFRMELDLERLALAVKLGEDEETKYKCNKHLRPKEVNPSRRNSYSALPDIGQARRRSMSSQMQPRDSPDADESGPSLSDRFGAINKQHEQQKRNQLTVPVENYIERQRLHQLQIDEEEEPVWVKRASFCHNEDQSKCTGQNNHQNTQQQQSNKQNSLAKLVVQFCRKEEALVSRRELIAEWHSIATIIDRLLFWLFLAGTILAYIVILIVVPYSKPIESRNFVTLHELKLGLGLKDTQF